MRQKFIILLVEINAIRWKNQVGTENSRMKLKLYEACLMSAILQWRSSMVLDTGKKIDERMQWNAKQSIQIVTTSLKVNINVRSADEVKDVSNLEVFTAQYNDAISQYNQLWKRTYSLKNVYIVKEQRKFSLEQTFYKWTNSVSKYSRVNLKAATFGKINMKEIDQTKDQRKKKKIVARNKI